MRQADTLGQARPPAGGLQIFREVKIDDFRRLSMSLNGCDSPGFIGSVFRLDF
jgi:hypothetical protein